MNDTPESTDPTQVVCPATRDMAIRMLIIAAMLIGFGAYCFTDWGKPKYAKPESGQGDVNDWAKYYLTYWGPFVLIPPGVVVLVMAGLAARRKLVADDEGIGYECREKISWSAVTGLDASQLQSKQILHVQHGDGQQLTLDGYKLQNFKDLVAFVEKRAAGPAKGASDEA